MYITSICYRLPKYVRLKVFRITEKVNSGKRDFQLVLRTRMVTNIRELRHATCN